MFREFALSSGIRGFTYAQNGKIFEQKMWYFIMLVCGSLTLWDVIQTVQNYWSSPTATKVHFTENETLYLGSPTACIPVENSWQQLGNFQSASADEVYSLLDRIGNLFTSDSSAITFKNHSKLIEFDFISSLKLMMAAVSSITRAEHHVSSTRKSGVFSFGFVRTQMQNESEKIIIEGKDQAEAAYKWIKSRQISLTKAAKVSAYLLCLSLNMEVKHATSNIKSSCEDFKPTWVGIEPIFRGSIAEIVCFTLPSELFQLQPDSNNVVFSFRRPAHLASDEIKYLKFDFDGNPVYLQNGQNVYWQATETRNDLKIVITSRYKQLQRAKICSTTNTKAFCQFQCRNDFIRKWCNCAVVPFVHEPAGIEECSFEAFIFAKNDSCSLVQLTEAPDKLCYNQCKANCDRTVYSMTPSVMLPYTNTTETSLNVYATTTSFPFFEEIPLVSAREFLGALGGNLSLYLGINFLLLYYTVYYWISATFQKFRQSWKVV